MTAPLFLDLANAPDGGVAHWRKAVDGVRIRLAHWVTENAKGTLLLCPGRTEYIEKYGDSVRDFQKMGLSVVVIDWRGQGLSDRSGANRLVGHVDQFSDFQHDLTAMVDYAKDMGLHGDHYLCAHSMGGCITLRGLMNGLSVKAAAFSAPMWGIQLSPPLRATAWSVTAIANPFAIRDQLAPGAESRSLLEKNHQDRNRLTTDPKMFAYILNQLEQMPDFEMAGPSIAWLGTALREMKAVSKLPVPDIPSVTFLGTDEEIVDPDAIKARVAGWSNGSLEIVDDAKHEILMETPATRARFFTKVAEVFGL
ncbi:MAG: alpha/beta fold hydrolase [Planktomarina sp.]